jgi:ABC-type transport system involved in Fe-S cluster assembly fused permease/ATPase subunit
VGERGTASAASGSAPASRALPLGSPIPLLDDCLSSVDTHTEASFARCAEHARPHDARRSHRVSTVRAADAILARDGVAERGTHEESSASAALREPGARAAAEGDRAS